MDVQQQQEVLKVESQNQIAFTRHHSVPLTTTTAATTATTGPATDPTAANASATSIVTNVVACDLCRSCLPRGNHLEATLVACRLRLTDMCDVRGAHVVGVQAY